jgi:hypothetical protein
MQKIHVGVQKMIHSCADGVVSQINFRAINFTTLLESVENREISFIRAPKWLKTKKAQNNDVGVKTPGDNKRRRDEGNVQGPEDKKRQRVMDRVDNRDTDKDSILSKDHSFAKVFNPMTRNGVTQPKMDSGEEMCNNWSAKGFCTKGCTRTHATKNDGEKARWVRFLKSLIANYQRAQTATPQGNPPRHSAGRGQNGTN